MNDKLQAKLYPTSDTKRILSLDGGGIRGILTLGMLKKIEEMLEEQGKTITDHFDLIGGTSTGAIIASGLAVGKSVSDIIKLYQKLGKEIFGTGRRKKYLKRASTTIRALFNENYSSRNLEEYLSTVFNGITIGDQANIHCGLAINSKRADTYSLWTVANHPNGKYFQANSCLKLVDLCRASSAAPYYFRPKKLDLRRRNGDLFEATFIDGGVSLANNPTWITFLVAVVPTFGFCWQHGIDRINITSLGTGNGQTKEDPTKLEKMKAIEWSPKLSDLFMVEALEMNQIYLELFGNNLGPSVPTDSQFENLSEMNLLLPKDKLFSFVRHNVPLNKLDLDNLLGVSHSDEEIHSVRQMDHYENMDKLFEIGEKYASDNIKMIL